MSREPIDTCIKATLGALTTIPVILLAGSIFADTQHPVLMFMACCPIAGVVVGIADGIGIRVSRRWL